MCQSRSGLKLEGQSNVYSVAVCFHFSGVRPVGDGIITSSVTLVAPAGRA